MTWLLSLWVAFGLLDVPIATAFFVSCLIVLQSLLGLSLLCAIFPNFEFSIAGLVGPGFVVGATLWVVPVQLAGSGAKLNLTVAFILLAILIQLMRLLNISFSWPISDEFLGICVLAFVIMSNEWNQMIFVSLFLLMALALKNLRLLTAIQLAVSRWTLIATAGVSLIWSLSIHGPFWWIVTDDYSYYESLQIHLRDFGIWEPWGPTNISQYHWLSPAWVGQMSQITFADDWVVLTRVAPLIFSLSIAANTVELVKQVSSLRSRQTANLLLIIGCVFLFTVLRIDFSGTSTYAVFAFSATSILVLLNCLENKHKVTGWVLFLTLTLTTIFAKVFSFPVVFCIIIIYLCTLLRNRRRIFSATLFIIALASLVFYVMLLMWLGPHLRNGWSTSLPGFRTSARLLLPLTGPVIFPVIVSIFLHGRPTEKARYHAFLVVTGTALLFTLLAKLIIRPEIAINSDDYFLKPALYFALLVVARVIMDIQNRRIIAGSVLGLFLSLGLIQQFGTVESIISHMPQNLVAITRADLLITQNWVLPMIVAIGGAAIFLAVKKIHNVESYLSAFLLAVVLMFGLHLGIHRAQNSIIKDYSLWSTRETGAVVSVLGSMDLVEIGVWIAENTSRDSMIATNDLCARTTSTLSSLLSPTNESCKSLGDDYTLGHSTKRRFLLLGPRFAYESPELRDSYMSLSLRYGATPTMELQQELLDLGVDYFVLFTGRYPKLELSAASVIFSSGHYSVLDLRKPLN